MCPLPLVIVQTNRSMHDPHVNGRLVASVLSLAVLFLVSSFLLAGEINGLEAHFCGVKVATGKVEVAAAERTLVKRFNREQDNLHQYLSSLLL